jgi:UDPglucose 6-dehydrogenase
MKISIIGSGYVGLVTAAGFAHFGHEIVCIDIDKDKINKLNTGQCPVFEPGLETVLQQNSPRLRFSTAFEDVANSDAVFLCVGTPPSPTGHADLSALGSACLAIKDHIKNTNAVIVTKSTVPVGTGDKVADWLDHRFEVISNPEFLKEGDAVRDCLRPDRIIIGVEGKSPHYNVLMSELYRPFVRTPDQILFVKRESAELIKYANNAMLATRISFMNELARLCEVVGADVDDIRRGIGSDERIGSAFLYAGCSFGGSCFSKDLQSLVAQGEDVGEIMSVAGSALGTNNFHREWFFNKLVEPFAGGGGTVALWAWPSSPVPTTSATHQPSILPPGWPKRIFQSECTTPRREEPLRWRWTAWTTSSTARARTKPRAAQMRSYCAQSGLSCATQTGSC